MYRAAEDPAGPRPVSRSGWGAFAQAGYMVSSRTELSARYSRLNPRAGTDPAFADANELGAGVSYYLHGHDLKVQGDVFGVTDPALRRPVAQARLQLQLFF